MLCTTVYTSQNKVQQFHNLSESWFYPPFATIVTILKENDSFHPKNMATVVHSFQSKWVGATNRAP
jgi:hypothetical protein